MLFLPELGVALARGLDRAIQVARVGTFVLTAISVRYFRRRVGGITGDLAGATVVMAELMALFVFSLGPILG